MGKMLSPSQLSPAQSIHKLPSYYARLQEEQSPVLIIIIIINRHFRNSQLTMNRHKGARGDTEPGLTLIQVRFQ